MQLEVRRKDGPDLPCVRREELAQKRGYGRRSIKLLKTGGQEYSESHLLHDLHNLINLCLRIRGSRKNIPAMRNIKIFPGSLSERRIRKAILKSFTKNLLVLLAPYCAEIHQQPPNVEDNTTHLETDARHRSSLWSSPTSVTRNTETEREEIVTVG